MRNNNKLQFNVRNDQIVEGTEKNPTLFIRSIKDS